MSNLPLTPAPESTPEMDWPSLVFRPLLITALVACIAAGWVMSIEFLLPGWQGGYLVWVVALVTVETLVVERQLRKRRLFSTFRLQVRLAELGLMLVLVKFAIYLQRGWAALWRDVQLWFFEPMSFLDGDYLIGAMVLLTMWLMAIDIAGCLALLDDPLGTPGEREEGLGGLKSRFVTGALILLLAVGARQLNLSGSFPIIGRAQAGVLTWLPVVYFGLGLLLFGQARLSLLQVEWSREEVPVAPGLERRWAGWSLNFVWKIALVALLIPAGNTLVGLYALAWLLWLVNVIGQVVIFVFFLLFSLLLAPCLFLFKVQQQPASPIRPPTLPMPPPVAQSSGPPWLLYLRMAAFWIIVIVVLVYLARIYWRERQAMGSLGLVRWWLNGWRAFWAWLLGWRQRIEVRLRRVAVEPVSEARPAQGAWWQRWRARTTRERVRRLYLALVRRAALAGHPRAVHQTPFEYAAQLEPHLAEEEDALKKLTDAFVEARYSRRAFEPEEVNLLRRIWQRLQSALRKSISRSEREHDSSGNQSQ
jgi:hypothetical protein